MADGLEPPETTHAFTSVPRSANGSGSPRRPSTNLPAEHPSSLAAVHRTHQLTRPLPFFHPTRAEFRPLPSAKTEVLGEHGAPRWSSRASRKHRYIRHPLRVAQHQAGAVAAAQEPHIEEKLDAEKQIAVVEQRVRHSSTSIKLHPAWNLAFWVALVFVLGSTCWIINGFFLFLPLVSSTADNKAAWAWSAFSGGTLFEIGSYLMYVEALNAGHDDLFAFAVWELLARGSTTDFATDSAEKGLSSEKSKVKFRWIGLGSWRDIGFVACFIQMWAATIFWVSTIVGLPNVISGFPEDPPTAIVDVFYWTPQVVGGTGFIVSSIMFMLEVQKKWWVPNVKSMGWHVGMWNLIGAVGFTLCGALGYGTLSSSGVNFQSILSTFWGSWAFLIGSVFQLWESVWREAPDGE